MGKPAQLDPERDAKGRFLPGNQKAKGNAGGGRTQKIQKRIIKQMEQHFSEEDLAEILDKQCELAKQGDRHAVKFIYEYLVGRPVQQVVQSSKGESTLEQLLDELKDIGDGEGEDDGEDDDGED